MQLTWHCVLYLSTSEVKMVYSAKLYEYFTYAVFLRFYLNRQQKGHVGNVFSFHFLLHMYKFHKPYRI